MTEFEFVDELPSGGGTPTRELRRFADALRANPGKWAKYPHVPASRAAAYALAYRIEAGRTSSLSLGFAATVRDGAVFVRFVGAES